MNDFGWDMPPGCTARDIDRAAGAYPEECEECGKRCQANELEDGLCQECIEELEEMKEKI